MTRFTRVRGLLAAALLPLLAGCDRGAVSERFAPLRAGDAAPAYAARSLRGDTVALASLRGDVVVLNVWATWCVPCRREMPMLDSLSRAYASRGVRVVGVSIDGPGSEAKVSSFLTEHGISFGILHDPESDVTRVFQTRGVPETFLIDREGRIARHWIGGVDGPASGIRAAVDSLAR